MADGAVHALSDGTRPEYLTGNAAPSSEAPAAGRPSALLQLLAICIFFVPSSMIIEPIGAAGTVPLLLGCVITLLWVLSLAMGLHNPLELRHPGRIGITLFLLGSLITYGALYAGWTGGSTVATRAAADRWLILVMVSLGVAMMIVERVRTTEDAKVLVRALLAGGFFCCVVALVQFFLHINPMIWVRDAMPGFTYNGGDTAFQERGVLTRVSGTTFHSIELAVVAAMLLPLSIWRGVYDKSGRKWLHWLGTSLLVFAIAATVSRSGILGVVVGLACLVPFLPKAARSWVALVAPAAAAFLFLTIPGLVGTLLLVFSWGAEDPSITTRTDNYPRVVAMFQERPILGTGPGNFVPGNLTLVLDNQYLGSLVTMGVVGLVAIGAYFVLPGASALLAGSRARDPELRSLCGALAGSGLVAAACSAGFDSLSFPVFALTYPFVVGLAGAAWIMVKREASTPTTLNVAARKAGQSIGVS
ncbi:O-antigen ligase family protein [Paenarthrobacter sp. NPDC057355]|uniref:O-antigen ligase family protein n=1 Tax=Paenarthrobacter sp. NPDC057355 TaxID=3346105 RepID=UPI003629F148